jgi:hypothetical protein
MFLSSIQLLINLEKKQRYVNEKVKEKGLMAEVSEGSSTLGRKFCSP